jgi:hypothetical protein
MMQTPVGLAGLLPRGAAMSGQPGTPYATRPG